jgi:outer membrane protein
MEAILKRYLMILALLLGKVQAAEIEVTLDDPPAAGTLICLLYNSPNTFGDLREPYRTEPFEVAPENKYRIADIPAGTYALVVFLDENANGFLDKNFIGIPREPIAFSQRYRPKGPPSYQRAQFSLSADETRIEAMTLEQVLGDVGRIGVGLGVVGRSSPYRDYSGVVAQPIPAITYIGERFQILGPSIGVGLVGSGKTRLAGTLSYRIGVYDEEDSPYLTGMGDRRDTAMLGLALQAELWGGLESGIGYQHDVLDQIGGGSARLSLGKTFQWGIARITPSAALNWLSASLSNYDYGVTAEQTRPDRPAYETGDSWSPEIGLGAFLEVTRSWLIIGNLGAEFLDSSVRSSPIVSEDYVLKGFFAVNYVF